MKPEPVTVHFALARSRLRQGFVVGGLMILLGIWAFYNWRTLPNENEWWAWC